jgi:AhpD family alkylhydroperoxidase
MQNMDNLKRLPKLSKLTKPAMDAFLAYGKVALADGAIPTKYKELMAVAVALTTQCTYCLEIHKKSALEAGATPEELAETIHVAAVIRAGGAITHGTHLLDE